MMHAARPKISLTVVAPSILFIWCCFCMHVPVISLRPKLWW